ncbi:helix-turn-helix transcriptional regulator [Clostridium sp. C2-6-12]|uniref:helix-turn-helix domain-containing protein n=1 Tax=Clostridium sp. C2-6-12 TaxID=2698832 RepID=UPI0013720A1A|nr:helix-turn-helix transcriptional regulator [Clostridium sp. C2-6-12]
MINFKLHIRLAEKRMSQKELSEALDIRLPTISAYINNKAKHIPIEHLNKFCEYFDCGLDGIIEYINDENEK